MPLNPGWVRKLLRCTHPSLKKVWGKLCLLGPPCSFLLHFFLLFPHVVMLAYLIPNPLSHLEAFHLFTSLTIIMDHYWALPMCQACLVSSYLRPIRIQCVVYYYLKGWNDGGTGVQYLVQEHTTHLWGASIWTQVEFLLAILCSTFSERPPWAHLFLNTVQKHLCSPNLGFGHTEKNHRAEMQ